MRPSFNHWMYFMLPKSVGILVKTNFYTFIFFLFEVVLLFVFHKPWTEQEFYIENWFWCSWQFYEPTGITEAVLDKFSKPTNCLFYTFMCNCGHMVCNCGHMVCNCGHTVCNCGHMVCNCGHMVCSCGHMVCNCGHMVCKDKVLTEDCNKSLWVLEIHFLHWWPG